MTQLILETVFPNLLVHQMKHVQYKCERLD